MDRYTANRYIALKNQIASSGGSVPQELIDEVEALDATVNGDETQDPPIVGLVDIVGDLENAVEDLDLSVNGDSTAEPPVAGLLDRVSDLESSMTGLVTMSTLWTNQTPNQAFAAQSVSLSSADYDILILRSVWGLASQNNDIFIPVTIAGDGEKFRLASVNAGATQSYVRQGSVSGTSISFEAGSDTSYIIPIEIIGVKFT